MTLEEVREKAYVKFKESAERDCGLNSLDEDIVQVLGAMGTKVPALIDQDILRVNPTTTLDAEKPQMGMNDEKFGNLVHCTEDVFNANVKLKNPKNNHRVNWRQKKLIVKILETRGLVIKPDGGVISKDLLNSEMNIKKLEETIFNMSQQIQFLSSQQHQDGNSQENGNFPSSN